MGVMECSRRGCDNIMCHDYSEETGYICWECKSELESSNPANVNEVELFMDSEKENSKYNDEDGFSLERMFGE